MITGIFGVLSLVFELPSGSSLGTPWGALGEHLGSTFGIFELFQFSIFFKCFKFFKGIFANLRREDEGMIKGAQVIVTDLSISEHAGKSSVKIRPLETITSTHQVSRKLQVLNSARTPVMSTESVCQPTCTDATRAVAVLTTLEVLGTSKI